MKNDNRETSTQNIRSSTTTSSYDDDIRKFNKTAERAERRLRKRYNRNDERKSERPEIRKAREFLKQ